MGLVRSEMASLSDLRDQSSVAMKLVTSQHFGLNSPKMFCIFFLMHPTKFGVWRSPADEVHPLRLRVGLGAHRARAAARCPAAAATHSHPAW